MASKKSHAAEVNCVIPELDQDRKSRLLHHMLRYGPLLLDEVVNVVYGPRVTYNNGRGIMLDNKTPSGIYELLDFLGKNQSIKRIFDGEGRVVWGLRELYRNPQKMGLGKPMGETHLSREYEILSLNGQLGIALDDPNSSVLDLEKSVVNKIRGLNARTLGDLLNLTETEINGPHENQGDAYAAVVKSVQEYVSTLPA